MKANTGLLFSLKFDELFDILFCYSFFEEGTLPPTREVRSET
jgi:hypothetical protein